MSKKDFKNYLAYTDLTKSIGTLFSDRQRLQTALSYKDAQHAVLQELESNTFPNLVIANMLFNLQSDGLLSFWIPTQIQTVGELQVDFLLEYPHKKDHVMPIISAYGRKSSKEKKGYLARHMEPSESKGRWRVGVVSIKKEYETAYTDEELALHLLTLGEMIEPIPVGAIIRDITSETEQTEGFIQTLREQNSLIKGEKAVGITYQEFQDSIRAYVSEARSNLETEAQKFAVIFDSTDPNRNVTYELRFAHLLSKMQAMTGGTTIIEWYPVSPGSLLDKNKVDFLISFEPNHFVPVQITSERRMAINRIKKISTHLLDYDIAHYNGKAPIGVIPLRDNTNIPGTQGSDEQVINITRGFASLVQAVQYGE